MTIVELIVFSFAIWRITFFITREDGAFSSMMKTRTFFHSKNGILFFEIGEALECPLCVSFIVSLAVSIFVYHLSINAVLYALALSTGSMMANVILNRKGT